MPRYSRCIPNPELMGHVHWHGKSIFCHSEMTWFPFISRHYIPMICTHIIYIYIGFVGCEFYSPQSPFLLVFHHPGPSKLRYGNHHHAFYKNIGKSSHHSPWILASVLSYWRATGRIIPEVLQKPTGFIPAAKPWFTKDVFNINGGRD